MTSGANLSECGKYRYTLWRHWEPTKNPALFVMLNPSTADATVDDPTIRRCVSFAKDWGCGGVRVVNLFAYRSTEPKTLGCVPDPVGPLNDQFILNSACAAAMVVAAWGTHGKFLGRDAEVVRLLRNVSRMQCLGVTKDGHPRHPLYLRRDSKLQGLARAPVEKGEP